MKTFNFMDGKTVNLREPKVASLIKISDIKNDVLKTIHLLIDMSEGELDQAYLTNLGLNEFMQLQVIVNEFVELPAPK